MESKVMGCNRCGECYDGYHDIRKSNHINFTCVGLYLIFQLLSTLAVLAGWPIVVAGILLIAVWLSYLMGGWSFPTLFPPKN